MKRLLTAFVLWVGLIGFPLSSFAGGKIATVQEGKTLFLVLNFFDQLDAPTSAQVVYQFADIETSIVVVAPTYAETTNSYLNIILQSSALERLPGNAPGEKIERKLTVRWRWGNGYEDEDDFIVSIIPHTFPVSNLAFPTPTP